VSTYTWPDHLLTLDEWEALPEDSTHRFELVEGVLLVAPRPTSLHQLVLIELGSELNRQLPADLTALPEVEVLVDAGPPPTLRVPDLAVVSTLSAQSNLARFDAADVLLAVEILSPGTRRTDRVLKAAEYAEAGILHYWLVDLDPPVSLAALRLADGAYQPDTVTDGAVELTSIGPVQLDLPALASRR
jgi:Uma2 family endonuclease